MASVNRVTLLGRLGRDPKMSDAQGMTICRLALATTRRYKGRDGDKQGVERYAAEVICESLQMGARPQGKSSSASSAPATTTAAQYAAAKGRDLPRNAASAPDEDVPF